MPKRINSFIKAIKRKNAKEKTRCQWIVVVDELRAKNGNNFTNLCILEDVDILIGVSPNALDLKNQVFEVKLPKTKNIIAKRLVFKHRNSLELNVFLAHLNFHFVNEVMYTPLSSDEDMPLVDSCFPAIDKVMGILKGLSKSDSFIDINLSYRTLLKEGILFGFLLMQICLTLRFLTQSK